MKINLMQAINLRSEIESNINELYRELDSTSNQMLPRGEEYTRDTESFTKAWVMLETANADLALLSSIISEANNSNTVILDDHEINITTALRLAESNRKLIKKLLIFGNEKDLHIDPYSGNPPMVKVLNYDPSEIKDSAAKLKRKTNKLSSLIDEANYTYKVDVQDMYDRYMDA